MTDASLPICIAALYKFTPLGDCETVRGSLDRACAANGVKGTLLLAPEGINGTIAGTDAAIENVLAQIRGLPGCAALDVKLSRAKTMPFRRMKVRIKREIVTMGIPDIDPLTSTGHYVEAEDWNALIARPGTILIDTRNDYEVAVGSFVGAIDPQTRAFRDFPKWFRTRREELLGEGTPPTIAMFCTGGIRCEKSTAFLKAEGLDEVYHLKGGILKYLETVPAEQSLWNGECFVFDQRVTVTHGLGPGAYGLCHACRRPVSEADRESPHYVAGVSCASCHSERSGEQRAGYAERQRQERLAEARGGVHIGAAPPSRRDALASAPELVQSRRIETGLDNAMSFSIYDASAPIFVNALKNMSAWLDKAAAQKEESELMEARLAPDMRPLPAQFQMASDCAKSAIARLCGMEAPSMDDTESSFAELKVRCDRTIAFVESIDAASLSGSEDREVILRFPSGIGYRFDGRAYLTGYALPNFFFHVTTAYAILRAAGVSLGKADFLQHLGPPNLGPEA